MRGIRAFKSSDLQYDQYLIVIAGDVWLITGDDKVTAEWKYFGEYTTRSLESGITQINPHEMTQIKPKGVPNSVAETAKLIAMEMYAADWRDFAAIAKAETLPGKLAAAMKAIQNGEK